MDHQFKALSAVSEAPPPHGESQPSVTPFPWDPMLICYPQAPACKWYSAIVLLRVHINCPLHHLLGILKETPLSCSLRYFRLYILNSFWRLLTDPWVDLMMTCLMTVFFPPQLTYPASWGLLLLSQYLMISSSGAFCWLNSTVRSWKKMHSLALF